MDTTKSEIRFIYISHGNKYNYQQTDIITTETNFFVETIYKVFKKSGNTKISRK